MVNNTHMLIKDQHFEISGEGKVKLKILKPRLLT